MLEVCFAFVKCLYIIIHYLIIYSVSFSTVHWIISEVLLRFQKYFGLVQECGICILILLNTDYPSSPSLWLTPLYLLLQIYKWMPYSWWKPLLQMYSFTKYIFTMCITVFSLQWDPSVLWSCCINIDPFNTAEIFYSFTWQYVQLLV